MIEFKKVSKVYPNGTKGLIDVDLKIEQGERACYLKKQKDF